MGNRSYIQVSARDFKTPVTFYSHWTGEENVEAVVNVLERSGRIGDVSYLTAQIFFEFAKLGQYDGETGFGIDTFGVDPDVMGDVDSVYVDADTGAYTWGGIEHTQFVKP